MGYGNGGAGEGWWVKVEDGGGAEFVEGWRGWAV